MLLKKLVVVAGMIGCLAGMAAAQTVIPTPWFTSFYSPTTLYNGQAIPKGSIVKAFDPDGILCGMYTVDSVGLYGFMSTYGDDPNSATVDEGATDGQAITFKINDRPATVTFGDATFTHQAIKQVDLSASGTVAFNIIQFPNNAAGRPEDTVRFYIKVKNLGEGTDFYFVRASGSLVGSQPEDTYVFNPKSGFTYANPNQEVFVYFDVIVPLLAPAPDDTVNVITYTVISGADTTLQQTNTVDLVQSITDVREDRTTLPNGFTLFQNYPNPFNPSTSIKFSLPLRSEARLEVYNVIGQVVESRDLGTLTSGDHTVDFQASGLSSGIYFYRIVADQLALTRKMVLLK